MWTCLSPHHDYRSVRNGEAAPNAALRKVFSPGIFSRTSLIVSSTFPRRKMKISPTVTRFRPKEKTTYIYTSYKNTRKRASRQLLPPFKPPATSNTTEYVVRGKRNYLPHKWGFSETPVCICGAEQTAKHVVPECPQTKFEGGVENDRKRNVEAMIWTRDPFFNYNNLTDYPFFYLDLLLLLVISYLLSFVVTSIWIYLYNVYIVIVLFNNYAEAGWNKKNK